MNPISFRTISFDSSSQASLLSRVYMCVYDSCTDPDFSTQRLADEIGISRMHLHRKLKAAHNLSAGTLIRLARLARAAELLAEKSSNVTEVTFEVGFNHPSYFAKRFREVYGVSPSEYASRRVA